MIQAAKTLLDIHKAIQDHKRISNINKEQNQKIIQWSDEAKIRKIIEDNIYGIDISKRSVDIAKLSVFFKIALNGTKLPELGKNIMIGDTLLPANNIHPVQDAFDWNKKFPNIMARGGFDIIIGNPPYVRQEKLTSKYKAQINIPERKISSKMDLSGYFYFRTMQYLKNNGILGFISSDTWMTAGYGDSVQKLFLENKIQIILRPTFKIFQDADTTPAIFLLQKNNEKIKTSNKVKLIIANSESDMILNKSDNEIIRKQEDFKIERWNGYFDDKNIKIKIDMLKMSECGIVKFGTKTGYVPFFVLSKDIIQKFSIIDKYLRPLIPDNFPGGLLEKGIETEYILNVNDSKAKLMKDDDGKNVLRYIEYGEKLIITPTRGTDREPKPLHELPTMKSRKIWYSLKLNNTFSIFLSRLVYNYPKIYENKDDFQSTNTFVSFTPKNKQYTHVFLAYFSSSIFVLQLEKNGNPMGGGLLSVETINYKNIICPDFNKMSQTDLKIMTKAWLEYRESFDRKKLDDKVFKVLKFTGNEINNIYNKINILRKRRQERAKK